MQLPWWTVRTWGVALRRQDLHPANPTSEQPATPLSQPGVCGHKWGRGTGRSQVGVGGWGGGDAKACSGSLPSATSACSEDTPAILPCRSPLPSLETLPLHRPTHSGPFLLQARPLSLREAFPQTSTPSLAAACRNPPPPPPPPPPPVHFPHPEQGKQGQCPLQNWLPEAQPGLRRTVVGTQSWTSRLHIPGSSKCPGEERIKWPSDT